MRHPIVRYRLRVMLLVAALGALGLAGCTTQSAAADPPEYTPAEEAYMADMAGILDVERVDPAGSLAGGRNACYLLNEFGIDKSSLAGWEEHWHQPWERQWLEAAVAHLCPPE